MDRVGSDYNAPQPAESLKAAVSEANAVSTGALRQSLAKAARSLNQVNFLGDGREVTFTVDTETRRAVVKVVDTESKEVVAQWPPEYLLRMADELKSTKRNSG